jgi:protein-S-isoprenylcysteine O-methyltransferase Ste14
MASVSTAPWTWSTWLARSRAWMSITLLAPVAIGAVFSQPNFQPGSWGSLTCQSLGVVVFLLGAVMRWWSTLYIGGRKTNEVVCHGPYSICRNPIYCGTWLMAIAVALMIQSLVFGLALILVGVFYLGITIPAEERKLAREFPQSYAAYCARVPRIVPNFRLYESPEFIELRVAGLRAELFRMLRWTWIPVLCALIVQLRLQDWWPRLSNWP